MIGTAFAENDFFEYRLSVAPVETPASPTLLRRSSVSVSFGTLSLWQPLDGDYILTLEAEDTNGNIGEDTARVTVDNAPPGAPVLLRADVLTLNPGDPDDIEIEWSGPSDTDVDGFIVFRNGKGRERSRHGLRKPATVPRAGPDLCRRRFAGRRALLSRRRDGHRGKSEQRLERALRVSRQPCARGGHHRPGERRSIRAESEDLDIATVSFQYRLASETVWTPFADDEDGEPFEVVWDIGALAFGNYHLHAVATDIGTKSDPAPAFIAVVLGDVTPPASPPDLVARTVGDSVELKAIEMAARRMAMRVARSPSRRRPCLRALRSR